MTVITVTLNTEGLDALIKQSPELVDKAVRATAFEVEAIAKSLAAVDTGAMKASIFTKTSKGSDIPSDLPGDAVMQDPTPGKPPLMTAYVAPGVYYAMFVEFGHTAINGRFVAAQPFLTPAVEKADTAFAKYIKKVFDEVKT